MSDLSDVHNGLLYTNQQSYKTKASSELLEISRFPMKLIYLWLDILRSSGAQPVPIIDRDKYGDGGIRTLVPRKANAFRVRPVMTTSIRLHLLLRHCLMHMSGRPHDYIKKPPLRQLL